MFDSRPQYTPMMVIAHAYYFIHGQKFAQDTCAAFRRYLWLNNICNHEQCKKRIKLMN